MKDTTNLTEKYDFQLLIVVYFLKKFDVNELITTD